MPKAGRKAATKKKTAVRKSSSAVQGEGDYKSARKFNESQRAFVKRLQAGEVSPAKGPPASPAELRAAEKEAMSRSRGRAGDRADARSMTARIAAAGKRRGRA